VSKAVAAVILFAASVLPAAAGVVAQSQIGERGSASGIEAAFHRESYASGDAASLEVYEPVRGLTVQIMHAGVEAGRTHRRDVMRGVAVGPRIRLEAATPHQLIRVTMRPWPSGLYFARLRAADGRVGFAPFVLRPRKLGRHRVAVVLPTQTWQAYNFRDDNGDGTADTWYASRHRRTARLGRPFLDRGVPPHFRHYDLPFLHWLARTGKHVDFLSDADLAHAPSATALTRAYDLIVFPGHHEYVTTREYDLVRAYRDLGGNLAFLSANNFFWRIARHGQLMERTTQWRQRGRPEAAVIGVQYRANDRGGRKGAWVVVGAHDPALHALFAGTELSNGSRFGRGGVEIDATAPSSPPGTHVIAEIPNIYGPGLTAQMTYYRTSAGAKVFAAGAFLLVESVLEPDAPLPDRQARRNAAGARRLLENIWAELSRP
jgi:hypothetical protein